MYVLLFLLTAAVGLNAAWVASMSYGIVDTALVDLCLANVGGIQLPITSIAASDVAQQELAACLQPVTAPWALFMLAGAVVSLVIVAVLVVIGGWWVRRRLHRDGRATGSMVDAAQVRFTGLCDAQGLIGRHPDLWILRPGSRFTEAFTTGMPLRRPLVVMPTAVATGTADVFEPVACHELAHVQARDVALASAAWWSGWVSVSILVVAAVPFLHPAGSSAGGYLVGLLVAAAITAALLLFRAHVLRLREHTADRVAVDRSSRPAGLGALLARQRRAATPRAWRRLCAAFSCRPSPAARVAALEAGTASAEGGFLPSAVTSLILTISVQPVNQVLMNWTGWSAPSSDVLFAVTGILTVILLMPAWVRRFAEAPSSAVPERLWAPALGVGVGISAGFFLPGPGLPTSEGTLSILTQWGAGPALLAFLFGTAYTLVRIAQETDTQRRGGVLASTIVGAGIAAVTLPAGFGLVALWTGGSHAAQLRIFAVFGSAVSGWESLLSYTVIAAVGIWSSWFTLRRGRPSRLSAPMPSRWLLLAVSVIVIVAGAGTTAVRVPADVDADRAAHLPMLWSRWWISAIAGAVVLAMVVARHRRSRRAAASVALGLAAAGAVTVLSALAQFVIGRAAGETPDFTFSWSLLDEYVYVPLRLFLLLSVMIVPIVMTIRRRSRHRRALALRGRGPMITAATAAVCIATMFGLAEVVTGSVADARHLQAAGTTPAEPPDEPPPPAAPAAERRLGAAQVAKVAAAAASALPEWTRAKDSGDDEPDKSPCGLGTAEAKVPTSKTSSSQSLELSGGKLPPVGAYLTINVQSFDRPPGPEKFFSPFRAAIKECPTYTTPFIGPPDGKRHWRLATRPVGPSTYPTFGFSAAIIIKGPPTSTVTTAHMTIVVIGHNVIQVVVAYGHFGEPPARRMKELDRQANAALGAAVRQLQRT